MLGEHRRFFLWGAIGALALRLFFVAYFPMMTDDSRVYMGLATNWLGHGVYGQGQTGAIVPTDSRLPGYPAFLAGIFWLFGVGNVRAVLIAQALLDVVTCLVIGDLVRRTSPSPRAGRIGFALTATCPFLANYTAAVLTETLEIFFTAIALDCLASGFESLDRGADRAAGGSRTSWPAWIGSGAAMAACILLRPDGGILLAATGLYFGLRLLRCEGWRRRISLGAVGIIVAAVTLAPLVPWTVRNFRTLHHFQPLAPRYATETDELAPRGFNLWVKTWIAEYVSVEEIYWDVPGDQIDAAKLPARALDEPGRDETLAVIADYNETQDLTPELDPRFRELAEERIRAHPIRYYGELPVLRIADMWMRPRTELLGADPRWWEFNDEVRGSALSMGFGLLNLVYVTLAIAAVILSVIRKDSGLRYLGLLGGFVLLRSAFLTTIENPEPRYTLECYPVVMVWAAVFLAGRWERRRAV